MNRLGKVSVGVRVYVQSRTCLMLDKLSFSVHSIRDVLYIKP
jgi:hypothetical protein